MNSSRFRSEVAASGSASGGTDHHAPGFGRGLSFLPPQFVIMIPLSDSPFMTAAEKQRVLREPE